MTILICLTKLKKRLDQILVDFELCESREKAKRLILAGQISVKGEKSLKPGLLMDLQREDIELIEPLKYVSRGGLKIEGFLTDTTLVKDKVCIDVGSSTGGFTDFLLQNGARSVTCVDVGQGIIHWKLRNDPRVRLHENYNARFLSHSHFDSLFDVAVMDVSFISVTKILPSLFNLMAPGGTILTLVKPQFEAGQSFVKKGVVRDEQVQLGCVHAVIQFAETHAWKCTHFEASKLKGPKGNQEYFVRLEKQLHTP